MTLCCERLREGGRAPYRHMLMSGGTVRTLYAEPLTFMDMLLECSRFIDAARHDEAASKADVLDSMENRVSLLVGKLAAYPTSAAFAVQLQTASS